MRNRTARASLFTLPTTECLVYQFVTHRIISGQFESSLFDKFSRHFQFFLCDVMVVQAWSRERDFVQLLNFLPMVLPF